MLVSTAHRMEPPQPRRRRRWPGIVAGIVMVTAGSAAAALFLNRRGPALVTGPASTGQGQPMPVPGSPATGRKPGDRADAAQADVNGQVRTP